jgi:hypothetical protein
MPLQQTAGLFDSLRLAADAPAGCRSQQSSPTQFSTELTTEEQDEPGGLLRRSHQRSCPCHFCAQQASCQVALTAEQEPVVQAEQEASVQGLREAQPAWVGRQEGRSAGVCYCIRAQSLARRMQAAAMAFGTAASVRHF